MHAERLHVRPVVGRLVRDPRTMAPLPAEGKSVPCTPYWLRRLKQGDVEEVQAATPVHQPPAFEGEE